ncbi:MAG: succinyl-diaminopimelate desuccinylase [Ectothiorhodospiraceae bacterium]|jgi:succinyl-diaminopimelate desuccinylase
MSQTFDLVSDLVRRASVTPDDAGCQPLLCSRLEPLGFTCETLRFGEVTNLWACRGGEGPTLAFVGHTDVVPTGPESQWSSPPFEPTVRDGMLYARGSADMKGSIAAFVTAVERFVARHTSHRGAIALLITSDEEGPALNGTRRVVETLQDRGTHIDYCLVGEPSSEEAVADTIKIGRRGSLHGHLTVRGIQGHVAYPHRASNPVHEFASALTDLVNARWDEGNTSFPPTTFQISNIGAGTGATNVIPGTLRVDFNFRYSSEVTAEDLRYEVEHRLDHHELDYEIDWHLSAKPFLTESGALVEATQAAIYETTGRETHPSTAGGTSDGRFVAAMGAQIVELGPVNRSIHQIDEHVRVADLDVLSEIYERILERLLGREKD